MNLKGKPRMVSGHRSVIASQDASSIKTPTQLKVPAYLMNFPFTMHAGTPNNVWMEEIKEEERKIDYDKAYVQFMDLYNYLASGSVVYLLPSMGNFQDQVYVANLGIVPAHLKDPTFILSRYKSEPRVGEDLVGKMFFKMMGYEIHQPDTTFEGEADLKYLRDNIYIGGYGIRTDPKTYKWMRDKFEMEIVPVQMDDDYLYHFDCLCFPLSSDKIMMCTELISKKDIRAVERVAEIVDVPSDHAYNGVTNCVRFENLVLCASPLNVLSQSDSRYKDEKDKVEYLTKVCSEEGMEAAFFNLKEYELSGAMLSCMVCHLNYVDYAAALY